MLRQYHAPIMCPGVLQDKDLFVQFTDPNMLDMWVQPDLSLILIWTKSVVHESKVHEWKIFSKDVRMTLFVLQID